jgi:toxin ParE1/3/4
LRIRLLSPAIDEISQAALWFDQQRPGLGDEFWRSVDLILLEIGNRPRLFAQSEFASDEIDLRFALVRRFSFVIHFAIEHDEVQVVAVAHTARRPGYWLHRIHT